MSQQSEKTLALAAIALTGLPCVSLWSLFLVTFTIEKKILQKKSL